MHSSSRPGQLTCTRHVLTLANINMALLKTDRAWSKPISCAVSSSSFAFVYTEQGQTRSCGLLLRCILRQRFDCALIAILNVCQCEFSQERGLVHNHTAMLQTDSFWQACLGSMCGVTWGHSPVRLLRFSTHRIGWGTTILDVHRCNFFTCV